MTVLPFIYTPNWINKADADILFDHLMHKINWQTEDITMFGKKVTVPRLVAWYGDSEAKYKYSNLTHEPLPWLSALAKVKKRLIEETDYCFNSVLCNLYRNGSDYMGWHSDNEKELGTNPVIASISLGSDRRFLFRHRKTQQKIELILEHGSMLLMLENCQNEWQHSLPKSLKNMDTRINLTFRNVKIG